MKAHRVLFATGDPDAPAVSEPLRVGQPRFMAQLRRLGNLAGCCLVLGCSAGQKPVASSSDAAPAPLRTENRSQLFDVLLADEAGQERLIGRVAVDAAYRLRIVSVTRPQKQFLTDTLDAINDKTVLHVEAAPPEGAPKFAEASRVVDRSSPAFLVELQSHLKKYYDVSLRPVSK